jgi:hypothetical protein
MPAIPAVRLTEFSFVGWNVNLVATRLALRSIPWRTGVNFAGFSEQF